MNKLKPTDMMSGKRNKNADQAIKDAASLLYANGFLTANERNSVDARVEKWEKDFYRVVNSQNSKT